MQTVLGIDLGTQSIKVVFYDYDAKKIVASESSPVDLYQDQDGTAEQDASWWITALESALAAIPTEIKGTAKAIAVSGQQHGFVPVDKNGDVLTQVKLWCDTATAQETEELNQALGGEDECRKAIGNSIVSGYTAPKILWLKKNKPEAYAKLARILLPHDYLNFYLSGQYAMEFGDASGTGLFAIKSRSWNRAVLNAIDSERDLSAFLPGLVPFNQAMGALTEERASALGLPSGIPIAVGGGDNMMAAIGTGNVNEHVVTMSLGSSGTVYAHSKSAVVDEGGRLAAFCSSTNGWLPLLCTMNCTLGTELVRQVFNYDLAQLESAINTTEIGASGVLCLPFFNGERTPNLPSAKGNYLGLDANNFSAENLMRATIEGATFGLRSGVDALRENGIQVEEIRLTGGGSKNAAWRQMIADICNARVVLTAPDEGAAYGAALQALAMIQDTEGEKSSIEKIATEHIQVAQDTISEPLSENVTAYETLYQTYLRAVTALSGFYK